MAIGLWRERKTVGKLIDKLVFCYDLWRLGRVKKKRQRGKELTDKDLSKFYNVKSYFFYKRVWDNKVDRENEERIRNKASTAYGVYFELKKKNCDRV